MAISRVIVGVTPFRALITLLITYLLSPLPFQVTPLNPESTQGLCRLLPLSPAGVHLQSAAGAFGREEVVLKTYGFPFRAPFTWVYKGYYKD